MNLTGTIRRARAVVVMAVPLACLAASAVIRQSAERGHRLAMQALAHIHEKGLFGVPPDVAAARVWNKKLRADNDAAHSRSTLRTP